MVISIKVERPKRTPTESVMFVRCVDISFCFETPIAYKHALCPPPRRESQVPWRRTHSQLAQLYYCSKLGRGEGERAGALREQAHSSYLILLLPLANA